MTVYCYKSEKRKCDERCEAFGGSVTVGEDSAGGIITGWCVDLAAKFRLAAEVGEIRKFLEKKKK
ncbi:MAG: hypothetical protein Q7J30_02545 [Candidatus Azambacteria bacterium]|nr:hypothetical protein [Candidatus Azambacteria bacterium]